MTLVINLSTLLFHLTEEYKFNNIINIINYLTWYA